MSLNSDQLEALHGIMKLAFSRMIEPTPVVELVALRILELSRVGEFDPDKIAEAVFSEFDL
jgi:hypothetical protein